MELWLKSRRPILNPDRSGTDVNPEFEQSMDPSSAQWHFSGHPALIPWARRSSNQGNILLMNDRFFMVTSTS
jgi:hypothetical protein